MFARRAVMFMLGMSMATPGLTAPPEALYAQTCIACHGANGKGAIPGVPDLTAPGGPLATKSDEDLARSILNGLQSRGSPMTMPPRGGNPMLSAEDAAALVSYLRERFERPAR